LIAVYGEVDSLEILRVKGGFIQQRQSHMIPSLSEIEAEYAKIRDPESDEIGEEDSDAD